MHILFLADSVFQDLPGGSRVVARELALGLTARGHAVTFLVPRLCADAQVDVRQGRLRIIRYAAGCRPLALIGAGYAAARRLSAQERFDVVHAHFAYAAVGPLLALPRLPCVRSFYGPWDSEGWVEETGGRDDIPRLSPIRVRRRLRRAVESANLRRSAAVIVLSEHSRSEVRAFRYPDTQVSLLPGGVDTRRFIPAKDKMQARRSLGLPLDRPILLSVRRLTPRMGLENLIQAIPAVAAHHPGVLLLLGGRGPEQPKLAQRIADLRLERHVRLTGFIPDDQLAAYYQAADAFILPTRALEGFGLVTLESLACGTPVLGTPIGATPELLGRLDPRLLLSGAGSEALADGIRAFLDHGRDWGLTPERLHGFVRANYSWEAHVQGMERIYERLTVPESEGRA